MIPCRHCGKINSKETVVCPHCNTDQAISLEESLLLEARQRQLKTGNQNRRSIVIAIIVGVIAITSLIITLPSYYYSKENQIKRLKSALNQETHSDITDFVVSTDAGFPATKKNLEVFLTILKQNESFKEGIVTSLSQTEPHSPIVTDGKVGFFYPKYKLALQPARYQVKTNLEGATVFLNNKELGTSTSEKKVIETDPLFPGTYVFRLRATLGQEEIDTTTIKELASKKNSPIDLSITLLSDEFLSGKLELELPED